MNGHKSNGISTLEAAGVCLIALTLLIGAAGVTDYLRMTTSISELARNAALAEKIQPLRLSLTGEISWDDDRVAAALPRIASKIERELADEFPLIRSEPRRFLLEVQVARVGVNSGTGHFSGIAYPARHRSGELSVPASLDRKTDLRTAIEKLVADESGIHPIPSGTSGVDGTAQYLPWVGMIGIRVLYAFDGSLTASVVSLLGISDYSIASDVVTVPFRGEVL